MPQDNYNLSEMTVNGRLFKFIDDAAQADIQNIIEAIVTNNAAIGVRINNLNDRAFDALIKISSNHDSEIASINDGIYKLLYVTITNDGDNEIETINNYAILIQQGTNQYLYKDGTISSRTYQNDSWGSWTISSGSGSGGAQGVQGAQGPQGAQGVAGSNGENGQQGNQGEIGVQGAQGVAGSNGENGQQGNQGEIGVQGAQGVAGSNGENGQQGNQGEIGVQGAQGNIGNQGSIGDGLLAVTSADNGKILIVANGTWSLISPSTLYSGSGVPNNAQGNNGDIYVQTN